MKRITTLALVLLLAAQVFAQVKSVSILGDSYSTFEGFVEPKGNALWYFADKAQNGTDVVHVDQTWWHIFCKTNGYKLCMNNSYSGSTICNTGYGRADYSDRSFITRMSNLGNPDIILIFGGTNDAWARSPIGEYKYGEWTKDDLYKFRPAMAYMLHYMTNRYLNCDIRFMLNSELSEEVNESVREICKHYGVKLIELHDISKQSGHPDVEGMKSIAKQLKK